jgi:pyruvate/2-oxoglutarate dehydrogenase complex dihydrolipoamide acyltransferase (E2) component
MPRFLPLERISSWRRISPAIWDEHLSPQVLGFDEIDTSALADAIRQVREQTGEHVTVTHFVVKALGDVMARHPDLNVVLVRGVPMRRQTVDVFVQVAVPKQGGAGAADLSGVKVCNVDTKTVADIARELRERATRVREGRDMQIERTKKSVNRMPRFLLRFFTRLLANTSFDLGLNWSAIGVEPDPFGCAMVTSCGGFGIHTGFAPLVPVARTPVIFLLGRTEDRPVVRDGQIVVRPMMQVGGTFDHRLLDGFQIGVICREFKEAIEAPEALVRAAVDGARAT